MPIDKIEDLLARTETPVGEIELYNKAIVGDVAGNEWLDAVVRGLNGGTSPEKKLADRPLIKKMIGMTKGLLVPDLSDPSRSLNLAPWGGTRIADILRSLPFKFDHLPEHIAELWSISSHAKHPNVFHLVYEGTELKVPIDLLGRLAPEMLFGADNVARFGANMPFLCKLLNSGSWKKERLELEELFKFFGKNVRVSEWNDHDLMSALDNLCTELSDKADKTASRLRELRQKMLEANLSVQVHPPKGYRSNEPSKTEAWVILEAEKGAGIYLGLKEGVTKEMMQEALDAGENITEHLNFVEVKPGDVFFIPAGTPHSVGAGILLYEPQETSESTFRYYDYDREPKRELHVKDALASTNWNAPSGKAAVEFYRRRAVKKNPNLYSLIDEETFKLDQVTLAKGNVYSGGTSSGVQGITVIEGKISILSAGEKIKYAVLVAGGSAILPAALGSYSIIADGERKARLMIVSTA